MSQQGLCREDIGGAALRSRLGTNLRVHRSHVVRLGFIAELHAMLHGDYEIVLRDGQRLVLSRRYKMLLPTAIRERL
jgi:DNA-binding LytR/AlgR family response regulator